MAHYIISGGTGLIGSNIAKILKNQGNKVGFLSRKSGVENDVKKYKWDIKKQEIDTRWLRETDVLIHLAGAGVADKRWTNSYKKEIRDSRIQSTRLLYETLKNNDHTIKTVVAGSAIGIYGNEVLISADENTPAGTDFLAKVCADWEDEIHKIAALGIRVVIIRTGIVLASEEGFIPKVAKPINLFAGAALGSGKQLISWIHIDDLCHIFIKAAEDITMQGAYNAVAPSPVTNQLITQKMATLLHKPLLLPNVPRFALNILFGEMADTLIANQNISSKKIEQAGLQFQFANIDSALANVLAQ
jgi:uncharacterized protein (TIGR01777 family)